MAAGGEGVRDASGNLVGIWGAMSDMSHSKWVIPGYEYIYVENEGGDTFSKVIQYLQENGMELVGAVHDFTCPETGKGYMFFPVREWGK